MGCACGKPYAIDDSKDSPVERLPSRAVSDLRAPRPVSSRREEIYQAKDRSDNGSYDGRMILMDKQVNGSVRLHGENFDRKREKGEYTSVVHHHPRAGMVPRASEGEQVAAGWPPWLAAVAGEAIKGWLPRRADSFEKLDKISLLSSSQLLGDIATFVKPGKASKEGEMLQTLSTISTESCTDALIVMAHNLVKLGILGKLALLMDAKSGSFDCSRRLGSLEKSKLMNDTFTNPGELGDLPPSYKFPKKLRSRTLSGDSLDCAGMSILGLLENLQMLKLKDKAFWGRSRCAVNRGFLRLEVIHIGDKNLVASPLALSATIGQGTYSNVYRARDLDEGKIVALKKVRFDNLEPESVRFMAREIHILRRLSHPNVIKLEGLVTSRMSCSLYLVFEYMEHDLAGLASHPGLKFTEPQVKCYMKQLLQGLDHCHSCGVLHRDIKGSNLLIDNNGILKIADFGLASAYDPHQSQPLTSRVVTLWYRPPELLLGATYYSTAVDLWSTGCILAELYAGKPIMPGRTEVEQLHKIFKLCGSPSEEYWRKSKLPHATIFKPQQPYKRRVAETFKEFPAPALALIEILLAIDPIDRGSAASALTSEFFNTTPHPCDPSSLPKYPPSKEFDAKVRDEEARRQAAVGSKGQRYNNPDKRGSRESRAVPAPDANAELVSSMQKRHGQPSSKSRSEMFSSHPEESASGFPIDPPRPSQSVEEEANNDPHGNNTHKRASHSGPLVNRAAWSKSGKNMEDGPNNNHNNLAISDLSAMSGLVAARRSMLSEERREKSYSHHEVPKLISRFPGSFKEASSNSSTGQDQKNNVQYEDERASHNNNPANLGKGSRGKKIHYSGPLLVPSGKVDQILKDHDRQIQEAVRRARMDKERMRKLQSEGNKISTNSLFVSGR